MHHVHTAYKWGFHVYLENAESTLRKTWIVCSSLRNGYSTFTDICAKLVARMRWDNVDFDAEVVFTSVLISVL